MNSVTLQGRISQEPEVRYTKTGKAVASFSVAVSNGIKNDEGKEGASFINVVAWQSIAESVGNSMRKGDMIFIHGHLQNRSYEGKDGQKRYVTEVVADLIAQNVVGGKKGKQEKPKADAAQAFGGQQVFPPDEPIPF